MNFGGSFKVGQITGVTVRVHVMLALVPVWFVMRGDAVAEAAMYTVVLFTSVLLHELGHCWGARFVGGTATEIVLWPLGGLTMMRTPRKWSAEFISTAAGPAVNFVLALVGGGLWFAFQAQTPDSPLANIALWVGLINGGLFVFNVIPAYPMDGGRLLRSSLWAVLSWRTATLIATVTALLFGASFVVLGLLVDPIIAIIGAMVLMSSFQEFKRARDSARALPRLPDLPDLPED